MKEQGITVHCIEMVREINPLKDLLALYKIYKIIQKDKYDIVHTHSSKAGVLGRLAARMTGVEAIFYSPHAFAFLAYPKGILKIIFVTIERIMAKFTTRLICVSESEKNISLKNKIINHKKIVTISNAIDISNNRITNEKMAEIKKHLGIENRHHVIGTVGLFTKQKGYPIFLKAVKHVLEKVNNVVFLVIGEGKQQPQIEKIIKKYDLEDNIILLGHVNNVMEYYRVMDVFVLTSLWEGMPYSILEAMSMSKPVVASDVPGSRDLVINGETGILVAIKDSTKVAEAITKLLKNSQLRKNIGNNAKKMIMNKYLITDRIRELEALYKRKNNF